MLIKKEFKSLQTVEMGNDSIRGFTSMVEIRSGVNSVLSHRGAYFSQASMEGGLNREGDILNSILEGCLYVHFYILPAVNEDRILKL